MDKKLRLNKLIIGTAIVLSTGILYFISATILGIWIRCPFKLLTGFDCPGCGVTRMCINIIHGNLAAAFWCNPVTFCLLPVLLALIVYSTYLYVDKGHIVLTKSLEILVIVLIIIYIIWGIFRNIYL